MNNWLDLARKGVTAVSGILAFLAALYGGLCTIWLVMNEPDAFAILAGASIIGAAMYLRSPPKIYNLQMSSPETEAILTAVRDLIQKYGKGTI